MRKSFFTIVVVVAAMLVAGCRNDNQGELAARTAKLYYDALLEGRYEQFVDGTYHKDSLRPQYRQQLIDNARMFVGQQKDEHRGIREVRVSDFKLDSITTDCNVFLVFAYGDSTSEEVLVPMTEKDGVWLMK